jgi:hypothetical protein
MLGACSCGHSLTTSPQRIQVSATAPDKPPTEQRDLSHADRRAYTRTFSIANVKHNTLNDCIDFKIVAQPQSGVVPEWVTKDAADLRAHLARLGAEVQKPCVEQFANKVVLATCYAVTKRDDQVLELVERYYNPDTVGMDDIYMTECLRLGGTWQAVAQDSPEFRKARADATLRKLEALASGSG